MDTYAYIPSYYINYYNNKSVVSPKVFNEKFCNVVQLLKNKTPALNETFSISRHKGCKSKKLNIDTYRCFAYKTIADAYHDVREYQANSNNSNNKGKEKLYHEDAITIYKLGIISWYNIDSMFKIKTDSEEYYLNENKIYMRDYVFIDSIQLCELSGGYKTFHNDIFYLMRGNFHSPIINGVLIPAIVGRNDNILLEPLGDAFPINPNKLSFYDKDKLIKLQGYSNINETVYYNMYSRCINLLTRIISNHKKWKIPDKNKKYLRLQYFCKMYGNIGERHTVITCDDLFVEKNAEVHERSEKKDELSTKTKLIKQEHKKNVKSDKIINNSTSGNDETNETNETIIIGHSNEFQLKSNLLFIPIQMDDALKIIDTKLHSTTSDGCVASTSNGKKYTIDCHAFTLDEIRAIYEASGNKKGKLVTIDGRIFPVRQTVNPVPLKNYYNNKIFNIKELELINTYLDINQINPEDLYNQKPKIPDNIKTLYDKYPEYTRYLNDIYTRFNSYGDMALTLINNSVTILRKLKSTNSCPQDLSLYIDYITHVLVEILDVIN